MALSRAQPEVIVVSVAKPRGRVPRWPGQQQPVRSVGFIPTTLGSCREGIGKGHLCGYCRDIYDVNCTASSPGGQMSTALTLILDFAGRSQVPVTLLPPPFFEMQSEKGEYL